MIILLVILVIFIILFLVGASKKENNTKAQFLVELGDEEFIKSYGQKEYDKIIKSLG